MMKWKIKVQKQFISSLFINIFSSEFFNHCYLFHHNCGFTSRCKVLSWLEKTLSSSYAEKLWYSETRVHRWTISPFVSPAFPWELQGQQLQIKPPHFSIHQHRLHFALTKSQTVPTEILDIIKPSCSCCPTGLFLLTSSDKFAWEAIPETYCLHGQIILTEFFQFREVATWCWEILAPSYKVCLIL